MEIYLIKTGKNSLTPSGRQDQDLIDKMKFGDVYKFKGGRPRNGKFFRKFMALMNWVLDNQERHNNMDNLLVEMKVAVGHYMEYIRADGEMIYVPKSISFASMDEEEFGVFFNKCVQAVIDRFMEGMTTEEVYAAIGGYL